MPRGAANRALIRGFPNGGTHRPSWVGTGFGRGVRREVKHLSTCRKGYSVSSGERKRMMAKPCACDTRRGLRCRCRGITCPGSDGPGGSHKTACQGNRLEGLAAEGASPVPGREPSSDRVVPSSAGLVESRVNQPRPLGKSKHTCLTDSVPVP